MIDSQQHWEPNQQNDNGVFPFGNKKKQNKTKQNKTKKKFVWKKNISVNHSFPPISKTGIMKIEITFKNKWKKHIQKRFVF